MTATPKPKPKPTQARLKARARKARKKAAPKAAARAGRRTKAGDAKAARKRRIVEARRQGQTWREMQAAGIASVGTISALLAEDEEFRREFDEARASAFRRLEDALEACALKALDDPSYQRSLIFWLSNNGMGDTVNVNHRGRVHHELGSGSADRLAGFCDEALRRFAEVPDGEPDREAAADPFDGP